MTRNTLVIPDIHGRYSTLTAVLEAYPDHDYIFLGDLIDRGPANKLVMETVISLIREGRAQFCYGNHEMMALDAVLNPEVYYMTWLENGGWNTIQEFADDVEFSQLLSILLNYAQPYIIKDDVLYCHAAPPLIMNGHVMGQYHIWNRPNNPSFPLPAGCTLSVHGHTPLAYPYVDLDEGCAYIDLGLNKLAVFEHESRKVIQEFESLDEIENIQTVLRGEVKKRSKYRTAKQQQRIYEEIATELDDRLDYLLNN